MKPVSERKNGSGRRRTVLIKSGEIGLKLVCWWKLNIANSEHDADCGTNYTNSNDLDCLIYDREISLLYAAKWCDKKFDWLVTLAAFLTLMFHKVV